MTSISLSHRASATFSLLSLVIYRCHPYGALPCIWNRISTKMSPLRGFAIHSKVEKTLEKPAFTQLRKFFYQLREITVLYYSYSTFQHPNGVVALMDKACA